LFSYRVLQSFPTRRSSDLFIEELEQQRKDANVAYGVLVQAAHNSQDTNYMLKIAQENQWIKGVVGWLPLMDPKESKKHLKETYLDRKSTRLNSSHVKISYA